MKIFLKRLFFGEWCHQIKRLLCLTSSWKGDISNELWPHSVSQTPSKLLHWSAPQSHPSWLRCVRCFYLVISVDQASTVCLSVWVTPALCSSPLTCTCQSTLSLSVGDPGSSASFPLVHGLTDCCCNFPVKTFLCEVKVCLTPDVPPTATQKPPVFIYWWSSGFLKAHPVN